jgi:hypothetical protein
METETYESKLREYAAAATPGVWSVGTDYCEKCDEREVHLDSECPAHLIGPAGIDVGDYDTYSVADMRLTAHLSNKARPIAALIEAARLGWHRKAKGSRNWCLTCKHPWPCPTAAALKEIDDD